MVALECAKPEIELKFGPQLRFPGPDQLRCLIEQTF